MVEEVATCNCERWQTLEWSMNTLTLMSPIPTIAQSRNKCLRVIFSLENDMRSFVSMKKSQGCGMKLEKKKKALNQKSASLRKKNPNAFFCVQHQCGQQLTWGQSARVPHLSSDIVLLARSQFDTLTEAQTIEHQKLICHDVSCSNFIMSCLSSINHPK